MYKGLFLLASLTLLQLACSFSNESNSAPLEISTIVKQDTSILPDSSIIEPMDSIPAELQQLQKAYPQHIKALKTNSIIWMDDTEMPFDDGLGEKSFKDLLNSPDLQDMFQIPYTAGETTPPLRNKDPGRVRYEPFFFKMYGSTKEEVRKNLTTIQWLPKSINKTIKVTTINGVDKKLKAISTELEQHPELRKYLENPGGTFNWRKIAGTDRQSMHSFGMTIDINVKFSNYWRWAIKGGDDNGKKIIQYKNRIPWKIVEIFEKHGFIWGGKWYHYDTMHFEYRPELFKK